MEHYIPNEENADQSNNEAKSGKSGVSELSRAVIVTRNLKRSACGLAVFGLLLIFLIPALLSSGNENYTGLARLLAFGIMFIVLGPLIMLHKYLWYSTVDIKIKAAWMIGLVILYFFFFNGFLMLIYGEQLVCEEFYMIYIPEIGFCDCDDRRPLLSVSTSPVFVPQTEFAVEGLKIASIGDIEIRADGRRVLELVKSKNPDLLVINGDLTYLADPEGLDAILTNIFGENFPVFVTVGNHDTGIFTDYQEVIQQRYERYLASVAGEPEVNQFRCEGLIGVDTFCSFNNVGLIFSGLGSTCGVDSELNVNLASQLQTLEDAGVVWRTVFIHKNQRLLQTGGKSDEVGFTAYENSLSLGAVVMNSHEHSYARTKELSGVGPSAADFDIEEVTETINGTEVVNVGLNRFAVVANGLGGKSLRGPKDGLERNPWWAVTFNDADRDINFGAHFCEYGVLNDTKLAQCSFETVAGFVVDEYFVRSAH